MDSTSKPEPKASALPSGLAAAGRESAVGAGNSASSEQSAETEGPSSPGSEDKDTKAKAKRSGGASKAASKAKGKSRAGMQPNNVRKLRQEAMMSKAELARRAGVSPLTIDRVESGKPCRMDTKRKILEALGLSPSARAEVWPGIDEQN